MTVAAVVMLIILFRKAEVFSEDNFFCASILHPSEVSVTFKVLLLEQINKVWREQKNSTFFNAISILLFGVVCHFWYDYLNVFSLKLI